MSEAVIVALVGGSISVISIIISSALTGNKVMSIMKFQIDRLEKKVDKHNNVIERVYKLEARQNDLIDCKNDIKEEIEKLRDKRS